MGKASFAEIMDSTGRIQFYINRDEICPGEDKTLYNEVFKKLLDLGDFIGIKGFAFYTQTGELTIHVKEIKLLSKALRPLPVVKIDDEGKVTIAAVDKTQAEIARKMIAGLTEVPEIGKIYDGVVKGIKDFGAFVEILPGKEGLLHISEIDNKRVVKVEDVLKFGQAIQVKLMGIDDSGKLKLSRKVLLPKETAKPKTDA
jgi:ribosomal protein S1